MVAFVDLLEVTFPILVFRFVELLIALNEDSIKSLNFPVTRIELNFIVFVLLIALPVKLRELGELHVEAVELRLVGLQLHVLVSRAIVGRITRGSVSTD